MSAGSWDIEALPDKNSQLLESGHGGGRSANTLQHVYISVIPLLVDTKTTTGYRSRKTSRYNNIPDIDIASLYMNILVDKSEEISLYWV